MLQRALLLFLLLTAAAGQAAAATFVVTNTDDFGPGSLRQAILDASFESGNLITFAIDSGPQRIRIQAPLPPLSAAFLDGNTQPGFVGEPLIWVDGSLLPWGSSCMVAGGNLHGPALVRGLVISNCPYAGIQLLGNSRLLGSWIGLDPDGVTARPNLFGVVGSSQSFVGGFGPSDGNLVSGNSGNGILLLGGGSVFGNRIGTDKTGLMAVPNGIGVGIVSGLAVVGAPSAGNLISGNANQGISVSEGSDVRIVGNRIGCDIHGAASLPPQPYGLLIANSSSNLVEDNLFVGNGTAISIEQISVRNLLTRNRIRDNGFGIDLLPIGGVTPNDPDDEDIGPNLQQNYPVLTAATASGNTIAIGGTLNSLALVQPFTIELFASSAGSSASSAHRFLGSVEILTDVAGNAAFFANFDATVTPGELITSTATDEFGNTSELSAPIAATASPVTVSAIDPDSGDAAGGETIDITGMGFQSGAVVTFGIVPAIGATVVGATAITATTPALPPGTLHTILVTNPDDSIGGAAKVWFANFLDVPETDPFQPFVEKLIRGSVSSGCGGGNFCRDDPVTRAQMSIFLLRSKEGPEYLPPPETGFVFTDVPAGSFAAAWIEELVRRAITGGCGPGIYCPDGFVTRAQMSVLLLRTLEGPMYNPPPATGTMFLDVPAGSFAAAWIEEIATRGITAGCGGGNFCPDLSTTRGQMAVFLVETFGL